MDEISNYYERPVLDCIKRKLRGTAQASDLDYMADVACVALNQLPARYVRHVVDTRFFESEDEQNVSTDAVERAVSYAIAFINERSDLSPDGTAHFRPGSDPRRNT